MTQNAKKQIIWADDLYGMVQRQDLDKIPDSNAIFLKNITLSRMGNWTKRPGSDLLATTQAGADVYGLISYAKNDGTYTLRSIRDRDVDTYSPTTDTWTEIDANQFTASTKIESTNFLNRVYHISTADFLCYETGGTCTDVGAGADRIKGIDVETAQRTLFVGGITFANGSTQTWQDRVYYSLFNAAGDTLPSDQLWNASEGSLGNSTRFFTVEAPVKGLYRYDDLIHVFTDKNCITFNMRYEQQDIGPQVIFDRGLANARAVCACNGYMIFVSPDKRLWAWGGSKPLMPISWDIEDDVLGRAIVNAIAEANVANIAIGALGNEFWISVGNITFLGETITNAVFRGLISQNLSVISWSVDSYPVKPVIFANTYISNKEVLCFGASGVEDVYRMNIGTNDDTTAIDAYGRTKFFDFGLPVTSKKGDCIYIKYTPQSTRDTYLEVKYAVDGKYSYTAITDPDNTAPVINHGKINMYASDSSTNTDAIKVIEFPAGITFRTISIEVGNGQSSESFEVKSIGFGFTEIPLDYKPEEAV